MSAAQYAFSMLDIRHTIMSHRAEQMSKDALKAVNRGRHRDCGPPHFTNKGVHYDSKQCDTLGCHENVRLTIRAPYCKKCEIPGQHNNLLSSDPTYKAKVKETQAKKWNAREFWVPKVRACLVPSKESRFAKVELPEMSDSESDSESD